MDTESAWATLGNRSVLARAVHVRTRHIDDVVEDSLKTGIRQIVNLGAGLDSRAYRIDALRSGRVFELDLPATQEYKKNRVRELLGSLPGPHRAVASCSTTSSRVRCGPQRRLFEKPPAESLP